MLIVALKRRRHLGRQTNRLPSAYGSRMPYCGYRNEQGVVNHHEVRLANCNILLQPVRKLPKGKDVSACQNR